MPNLEQKIKNKAYELGYENCGIVPLEKLDGYGQKILERIQKVPESETFYKRQYRLIDPQESFPWAQSIIIVIERNGRYRIPDELKGRIGKHYLFDTRIGENTNEFQAGTEMENHMQALGLRFAGDRKFGLAGLRWAAMKAGLGIIRKNNFFYTKSGSWGTLQGWLIDQTLELTDTIDLPQCPDNCNRCIKACPSGSLLAPYTMSPAECISYLTTFGGRNLPVEPLRKTFGQCLYGCDICQEACPMNKGKWKETEDFPGVSDLAPSLTPEKIMEMDEAFYKQNIQPKFFYLNEEELWKWQVNALCFMQNNYQEKYKPYIIAACKSKNTKVGELARLIYNELHFDG